MSILRSKTSRIDRIGKDLRRLELIGVRASIRISKQARLHAISAYRTGNDPVRAVRDVIYGNARLRLPGMPVLIKQAMVAAHLNGIRRSVLEVSPKMRAPSRYKLAGTAYDDAIGFLKRRMELTAEELNGLAVQYDAPALNVAHRVSWELEAKLQRSIIESTSGGATLSGGMASLQKAFSDAGWIPGEKDENGKVKRASSLETVFRTQTQIAYGAGRWNALQDEAIQEILWGYEYVTVGDDRVRPSHAAMDGVKRPKDDPIWNTWWPPCGYNCRCTTLEIFDEGEATAELPAVEPDAGFKVNFGEIFKLRMAA